MDVRCWVCVLLVYSKLQSKSKEARDAALRVTHILIARPVNDGCMLPNLTPTMTPTCQAFFLFWRNAFFTRRDGSQAPTHHHTAGAHTSTRTLRTLITRYPNTRTSGRDCGETPRCGTHSGEHVWVAPRQCDPFSSRGAISRKPHSRRAGRQGCRASTRVPDACASPAGGWVRTAMWLSAGVRSGPQPGLISSTPPQTAARLHSPRRRCAGEAAVCSCGDARGRRSLAARGTSAFSPAVACM